MKILSIQNNQSLFDVALINSGTINSIIDLCVLNHLTASDFLEPGLNLKIENTDYGFKKLLEYLENQGIVFSTEVINDEFNVGTGNIAQDEIVLSNNLKTVLQYQSVFDLCSYEKGTITSIIDMCLLNEFSPSDDLIPGLNYKVQTRDYGFSEVVSFFKNNKLVPVTDYVLIQPQVIDDLIYLLPAGELPYSL